MELIVEREWYYFCIYRYINLKSLLKQGLNLNDGWFFWESFKIIYELNDIRNIFMYLDWLNDRLKYMNKGIILILLFFWIFIDSIYLWIF
jgi:hypothetical protein